MKFAIFASYGNDSIALIQWAHEKGLSDVAVVYNNTGWAAVCAAGFPFTDRLWNGISLCPRFEKTPPSPNQ